MIKTDPRRRLLVERLVNEIFHKQEAAAVRRLLVENLWDLHTLILDSCEGTWVKGLGV